MTYRILSGATSGIERKNEKGGRLFLTKEGLPNGFISEEDIKKISVLKIYRQRNYGRKFLNGIEGTFNKVLPSGMEGFTFYGILTKTLRPREIKEIKGQTEIRYAIYKNSIPAVMVDGFAYCRNAQYFRFLGQECPASIRSGMNVFSLYQGNKISEIQRKVAGRTVVSAIKTFSNKTIDWSALDADFPDCIRFFEGTFKDSLLKCDFDLSFPWPPECGPKPDPWENGKRYGINKEAWVNSLPEKHRKQFEKEQREYLYLFPIKHEKIYKNVFEGAEHRGIRVVVPNPEANPAFHNEIRQEREACKIFILTPARMDWFDRLYSGEGDAELIE